MVVKGSHLTVSTPSELPQATSVKVLSIAIAEREREEGVSEGERERREALS